jgi:hypothetical protein
MFSQGQLTLRLFFLLPLLLQWFSYRKDIKNSQRIYKGNYKILLGFLLFIGILFVIKVFFKR